MRPFGDDSPSESFQVTGFGRFENSEDLSLFVHPTASLMAQLVGGAITILKHMKVNGMMIIPSMKWKNKIDVPNHQPVL